MFKCAYAPVAVLGVMLLGAAPATTQVATTQPAPPPSAEFLALVPDPSAVVKVATGFRFVEGPTWLPEEKGWVFSDIPNNAQMLYVPGSAPVEFVRPSFNTNGTSIDPQGRLIVCRQTTHEIARREKDGTFTSLVSQYEGKRFNSTNDVVVARDGTMFFTDPPYGVKAEARELKFCGVFRLTVGGELTLLTDKMMGPNGIALSPDEKTLYVAETGKVKPQYITAFTVTAEGKLTDERRFYTVDKGTPDGMRVDGKGNVWTSAGDGVHVISPEGKLIGKILVPEPPANLAFGGEDGRTLLITARTSIYTVGISGK